VAHAQGAQVIVLPELFATPYFCIEQNARHLQLAHSAADSPLLRRFGALARELAVVLPISFFERAGNVYFNSLAVFDTDGTQLGIYRKSHIPNGPGYQEKFYFTGGDTGFKVWKTHYGCLGVGVCWDQWFPEGARIMALQGAELLLYPTAIGSEPPPAPPVDSRLHWQRTQQGHAAANLMPLVAANRIGIEHSLLDSTLSIRFYGSSFIADPSGALVAQAGQEQEEVISAAFDLDELRRARDNWFVFRDRRPDLYGPLVNHG
jgi:N-carbamoylputrescine amidase